MAEVHPLLARDKLIQLPFNDFWVLALCKSKAIGEALDMGIDDHSRGDIEGIAEDDIRGLSADSREGRERIKGGGNLALVVLDDLGRHGTKILGLGSEEARGLDQGLDILLARDGQRGGVREAGEEYGGYLVDPGVRTLSGEDRGDKKFVGVAMDQSAM